MKKITLFCLTLLLGYTLNAQEVTYFSDKPSAVLYTLPRTSLKVRVVSERQCVHKGVYARFAQKYLGVIAPLADKEFYAVTGASIVGAVESDPTEVYAIDASQSALSALMKQSGNLPMPIFDTALSDRFPEQYKDDEFTFTDIGLSPLVEIEDDNGELAVDIKSAQSKSQEQMAALAADAIFKLRKRRFDLITGESSENVFGEGLAAAIAEMKRLEDAYVGLFMGKTTVSQIVREYEIVPVKGKKSYIVCRFSAQKGFATVTDLSANPLILELNAEKCDPKIELPRAPQPANAKEVVVQDLFKYRMAVVANARLLDGSKELISKRIPIYQFGYTLEIPVNVRIQKL